MAEHLFPGEDALGKIVSFNRADFIVKGIYEDMTGNSHFKFDFIMSHAYQTSRYDFGWSHLISYTYLRLSEGTDPALVEEKMNAAIESHLVPIAEEAFEIPGDQLNAGGNHARFYLQPLTDIHLRSNLNREMQPNGSLENVRTISAIGLVILLIAVINFVNLSTARAATRAKEVGVRKVLGSRRGQLINQFLFESVMYSISAFVLATGLAWLWLPYFNELAGREITFTMGGSPPVMLIMLATALATGLLAGIYPALVLSAFSPEKSLKGQRQFKSGRSWLRSTLVIVQFAISTILVITTLVVNNQLDFVLNKSLGFAKDNLITLDIMDLTRYDRNERVIFNEFNAQPNLGDFTRTGYVPVNGSRSEHFMETVGGEGNGVAVNTQLWPTNQAYIPTMGMELVEGRNFDGQIASDSTAVILNEQAVKALGLTNPLEAKVKMKINRSEYEMHVIGVIKDFHYASMKESIQPVLLYKGYDPWSISIRFTGNPSEALASVQTIWENHSGGQPFIANLVSEQYRDLYAKESQLKGLVNAFSGLAIFIAILGLVGLAAYMAEQRKKEMGIRKVLGARMLQLFRNMMGSFSALVVTACLLAVPLAYLATDEWLAEYSYRISLSPLLFIGACLGMMLLAWVTVSFQSIRAAKTNPVDQLRTE